MKKVLLTLCAFSFIAAPIAASAETISEKNGVVTTTRTQRHGKQIEKVTCREFLELKSQFQPQVVSYAIGYDKARKPDDAVVDVEGIDRIVPVVRKTCRTTPEKTLMERIKADFHKL